MDATNPNNTLIFLDEQKSFERFRRALRRGDQIVLDDLFESVSQHAAAAALADRSMPFDVMLLCMLLEERKEVRRLRALVEEALTAAAP